MKTESILDDKLAISETQMETPIKARPCYYQLAPLDWSLEGKRLLSSFGSHLRWALSSGNVTIYSRGRGGWSSLITLVISCVDWMNTGSGFNRTREQMYRFSIFHLGWICLVASISLLRHWFELVTLWL